MTAPRENNHTVALVRDVSDSIAGCELTHLARTPIDLDRARDQHAQYVAALKSVGCRIQHLDPLPDLPDAVFVEDTAIVLDEVAIITHAGALSRRPETVSTANTLKHLRPLKHIVPPATLDGGDVLVLGKHLWVGQCDDTAAARSDEAGFAQLRDHLAPYGYQVHAAPIAHCLHLKSAVTAIGPDHLLINPQWVDPDIFKDLGSFNFINTHPDEPNAANALLVNSYLIYPDHHPHTRDRLDALGLNVVAVPADELAKAEGGVTCCSIIV